MITRCNQRFKIKDFFRFQGKKGIVPARNGQERTSYYVEMSMHGFLHHLCIHISGNPVIRIYKSDVLACRLMQTCISCR